MCIAINYEKKHDNNDKLSIDQISKKTYKTNKRSKFVHK